MTVHDLNKYKSSVLKPTEFKAFCGKCNCTELNLICDHDKAAEENMRLRVVRVLCPECGESVLLG